MAKQEPSKKLKRYVDNRAKGMDKQTASLKADYSVSTSKSVKNSIESTKNYEELLNEYLPDSLILGALRDDIKGKPRFRATEINIASKIKGMQSDKLDITSNGNVIKGFNFITNNPQKGSVKPVNKKDE